MMSRGVLPVLILATLLSGCGASARDAVELARARWEHATGLIHDVPTIVEVHGMFNCSGQRVTGCWSERTQTLTLDVDSVILEWAATHEWGHVLGAEDGSRGTMMCHSFDCSSPVITRFDVWSVCDGPNGPCKVEKPERWLQEHFDQIAATQSY